MDAIRLSDTLQDRMSETGASLTPANNANSMKMQRRVIAENFPDLLPAYDYEVQASLMDKGQKAAAKFLSGIKDTEFSPEARRREAIKQGKNFSRVVQGRTAEATRAGVGAAVGELGEGDFDIARKKFADSLIKAGLSQEQQNKSLMSFDRAIIQSYNDQEKYNELQAQVNKEKEEEVDGQKSYNETLLKAMQAQEAYRQNVHEAQRALATLARDAAQGRAMFGLGSGLRIAQAGARENSLGGCLCSEKRSS